MNRWSPRLAVACVAGLTPSLWCAASAAQHVDDVGALAPVQPTRRLHLDEPEPWAVTLRGHGGLGVQAVSSEQRSFSHGGVQAGFRVSYLSLTAIADHGVQATETTRTVGGLLGAHLPFSNWVDVEAMLGVGSRRYINGDRRYGPDGFDVGMRALLFSVMVSDRAGDPFGVRFGAGLMASVDLGRRSIPWTYGVSEENPEGVTGTRDIGGTMVGLVLQVGLEYAPR